MRYRTGIASRLLAAYLGALLPVALLFGWWAHGAARSALERELGLSLATTAAVVAADLERSASGRIARLDLHSDATRQQLALALEDARSAGAYRRIALVNPAIDVLVDTDTFTPFAPAWSLLGDRAEIDATLADGVARASVLFRTDDDQPFMRGYARVLHEGQPVALVSVEGDARFFAGLSAIRTRIYALGLALLLMVAIVTAWAGRRITAPLTGLARTAERVGAGDFSAPVPEAGDDEIGALAAALRRMQNSLAARDEEARMMLAGIAHEIRNPLGGMELYTGLLEESLAPGSTQAAHAGRVRKELDYLERVVHEFLAFARDRPLNWTRRPARELVESARCDAAARRTDVEVRCDLEPADVEIAGDQDALRGALINVVRNAIEASPPGESVRVSVRALGDRRTIEVCDRGPGMTPDRIEDALRPFFTTREKGTGLGLPLARKVAERHGGTLTILSPTSGGTTVRFELPFRPDAPGTAATSGADSSNRGSMDPELIG